MTIAGSRIALVLAIILAIVAGAPRSASALYSPGYCTSNVTCQSNWSITPSNGAAQSPEIVLIFWQDSSEQWTLGNGGGSNPTETQLIGSSLALINSPYFNALDQYGASNGGFVARPRMSPQVPLFTGAPPGYPSATTTNFSQNAINAVINQEISAGGAPAPMGDDTVYVVFTPAYANCPGGGSCVSGETAADNCNSFFGCNWNCNNSNPGQPTTYRCGYVTANSGSGGGAATFAHETAEAISGENGITVNNCSYKTGPGSPTQIVDLCCSTEQWSIGNNPYWVPAYYSQTEGACVIPESWEGFYVNTNAGGGWTEPTGSFNPRQLFGGAGGVVATDTNDNVYFYSQSSGEWLGYRPRFCPIGLSCWTPVSFGGSGAEFAAGGGIVAGITPDVQYGINTYALSQGYSGHWTSLGSLPYSPPTSVTVTSQGVVVATDWLGQPWYYDNGWVQFGNPGDQFVASGGNIIANNLTGQNQFEWPASNFGPGGNWQSLSSLGTVSEIIANPDAPDWVERIPGVFPEFGVDNSYYSTSQAINLDYAVINPSEANGASIQIADANDYNQTYYCDAPGQCGTSDPWTPSYAAAGRLISGGTMYATSCQYPGMETCVNYYTSYPGCAADSPTDIFGGGMVGCGGQVTFPSASTLCGEYYHVCSSADWDNNREGTAPTADYWTSDNLEYNGSGSNDCEAVTSGGLSCGTNTPMRVCTTAQPDKFGNRCNWVGCGLNTYTNQYFGGCVSDQSAGALCCPN